MRPKIYLEPRSLFDQAILVDEHPDLDRSNVIYSYYKLLDVLVEDFKSSPDFQAETDQEAFDVADEYFWFNIERLKDYYAIEFDYAEQTI